MTEQTETPRVHFPELIRTSTHEFSLASIFAMLGCMAIFFSNSIGIILIIPGIILIIPLTINGFRSISISIRNVSRRTKWAQSFKAKINHRSLRRKVLAQPERYTMHVQYYGGLGTVRLCPAAILEDQSSSELTAVHPPSHRAVDLCESHCKVIKNY